MAVSAVMLTGCKDYDEEVVISSEPVTVELAYTFSSVAGTQTRQSDDVVTSDQTDSRYPQNLTLIPMIGTNPQSVSVTWNLPVVKEGAGDKPKSLLYHSIYCNLGSNVNRCFVYGSVENLPSDIPAKVYNGSLIANHLTSVNTQSALQTLSFSLESIYNSSDYIATDGIPEEASTLAGYLNTVAEVSGWQTSDNAILKNLFENFTGHGSDLPGSAASVKEWLEALATAVASYLPPNTTPSSLTGTETTILENIQAAAASAMGEIGEITGDSYPRNRYLPDGAAALRWTTWTDDQGSHEGFKPAMQTTTLDNINSVSRFVYPAPLFFFVDSDIKASETKVDFATVYGDVTTTSEKTAWTQVLENNLFTENKITPDTKSVALEDPVQYAVAQLKVTVKAAGASLKDNAETDITIGETTFPLTGVIICGQRPVNYRFEQASNSDVDVKFIYDSQVKTNGSDYYYLTTADPNGGPSTLVLQSYEGEDVDIILEFQNNGSQTFKCIDGFVYPGTRFYLIGKVESGTGTEGDSTSEGQVFTKDYITTVNMTVSSLAKAYNVLPNLLTSNLEIGVETTPEWVAATSTTVVME